MNEDEEFFAWLDGELTGEAAERVAARVAGSPELAARADRHRQLAAGLRRSFDTVASESQAPPSFGQSEIIDFGARATGREPRRFAIPQWAAMAASLALGLVVGSQLIDRNGGTSPVATDNGRLVAAASLDRALNTRLASAPASNDVRIGLTFRSGSGTICRSFINQAASGLACRDGGQWRIRGLFQGAEGQSGDYRMASGEDPRLASLVDETIAGEPLDAAQEKAALEAGWR